MTLDEKTYGQRLIEAAKQAREMIGSGSLLQKAPPPEFDRILIPLLKRKETPAGRMRRMKGSMEDAGSLEKFIKQWYSQDKIVCLPSSIKFLPVS